MSIVGAGNLGTALALTLPAAGYAVKFIATRTRGGGRKETRSLSRAAKARVVELGKQPLDTDMVWITVPDDAIAADGPTAGEHAGLEGKNVFHSSGALTSDELAALREGRQGRLRPSHDDVRARLRCRSWPEFLSRSKAMPRLFALRERSQTVSAEHVLHPQAEQGAVSRLRQLRLAAGIALMASLERWRKAAGVRPARHQARHASSAVADVAELSVKHDAALAFSGPLVRGDVATVRRHLDELKKVPEASGVYVALAKAAVKSLPVKNRKALEDELKPEKKLTHQEILAAMRALRRQIKPDKMSVREMVRDGRRL